MKLSEYYPEMSGWTSTGSPMVASSPQIPNEQTQVSPFLRTTQPLPLQYSGDTIKQFNLPGISRFRFAPLPPGGLPTINSAAGGVTKTIIEQQSGGSGILLETDGVPNASQSVLNIIGGTGVTATSDSSGGVTLSSSGSGGGSVNTITYPTLYASLDTSFNGFTIFGCIRGSFIVQTANTWNFTFVICGGPGIHIAQAAILQTLHNDLNVITTTPVTFGGLAAGNVVFGYTSSRLKPYYLVSDTINLAIDTTHDYWMAIYLDNDGTYNGSLGLPENNTAQNFGCGINGGFLSGNQISATPINTSFSSGGNAYVTATKVA